MKGAMSMKRFICIFTLICMLFTTIFIVSCDNDNGGNVSDDTQGSTSSDTTSAQTTATTAATQASNLCAHDWEQNTSEDFTCGTKSNYTCKVCNDTKTVVLSKKSDEHNFENSTYCKVCGSDKVTVNGIPLSKFSIVAADNDFSKTLASTLKNKFNAMKGYKLTQKTAADAESEYEIIVGNVGRSATSAFFAKGSDYLSKNYEVVVSDTKIYINVGTAEMAELAKNRLIAYFLTSKDSLFITDDDSFADDYLDIYDKVDDSDIRITSFNILADNISAKKDSALEQIKNLGTDILCLQEYTSGLHRALDTPIMNLGYKMVTTNTDLCTPIFYRDDVLDVMAWGSKIYESVKISDNNSKSYLWVLFKNKATQKQFIVIGTHFSYVNDELRQSNANEIVAKIADLRSLYGADIPIVLTGDFNAKTSEQSYKIVDGMLDSARVIARVKHNTTYGTCYTIGQIPPQEGGYIIDHSFVGGKNFTVKQFQHIVNTPTRNISDHTPIITDIAFN